MKEPLKNKAWLSLGSNLGDRQENLQLALDALGINPKIEILAVSSLYQTAPVGSFYSEDFFNVVIGIQTPFSPEDLLNRCQEVENTFGRDRAFDDRTVDIDILLYNDLVMNTHALTIPHKELASRRFMLLLLLEISPEMANPDSGTPYKSLPAVADEEQKIKSLKDKLSWQR